MKKREVLVLILVSVLLLTFSSFADAGSERCVDSRGTNICKPGKCQDANTNLCGGKGKKLGEQDCYCSSACEQFGDCCSDYFDVCKTNENPATETEPEVKIPPKNTESSDSIDTEQEIVDRIKEINKELTEIAELWCFTGGCADERFAHIAELLAEREKLMALLAEKAPQRVQEVVLDQKILDALKRLRGVEDSAVDKKVETSSTVQGVLGLFHADSSVGSSSYVPMIYKNDGTAVAIKTSTEFNTMSLEVKATGYFLPQAVSASGAAASPGVFAASSVQAVNFLNVEATPAGSRVAVIKVNFPGGRANPVTDAEIDSAMQTLVGYYGSSSYNKFPITYRIFGPVTVPPVPCPSANAPYYYFGDEEISQAGADGYDAYIFIIPGTSSPPCPQAGCCGAQGWAHIDEHKGRQWVIYSAAPHVLERTVLHEFGHSLKINRGWIGHNGATLGTGEYQWCGDVMGHLQCSEDNLFNSVHRQKADWFNNGNTVSFREGTDESSTVDLGCIEQGEGVVHVQIDLNEQDRAINVEKRCSGTELGIIVSDGGMGGGSIDAAPLDYLSPGEEYQNAQRKIKIKAIDSSKVEVTIGNGVARKQCADTRDNDGDGKVDLQDPGCANADDDNEADDPVRKQCADTRDNDGDTKIDLNDPGCSNSEDDNEADDPAQAPECNDGRDNDNNQKIDYPNDPGCLAKGDTAEKTEGTLPQCADTRDNDGDTKIDYGTAATNDQDCTAASDNSEASDVPRTQCNDGTDNDADGKIDMQDPGCTGGTDNDETDLPTDRKGNTACNDYGCLEIVCPGEETVVPAGKNFAVKLKVQGTYNSPAVINERRFVGLIRMITPDGRLNPAYGVQAPSRGPTELMVPFTVSREQRPGNYNVPAQAEGLANNAANPASTFPISVCTFPLRVTAYDGADLGSPTVNLAIGWDINFGGVKQKTVSPGDTIGLVFTAQPAYTCSFTPRVVNDFYLAGFRSTNPAEPSYMQGSVTVHDIREPTSYTLCCKYPFKVGSQTIEREGCDSVSVNVAGYKNNFGLSLSPETQTIRRGQTSTYSVDVTGSPQGEVVFTSYITAQQDPHVISPFIQVSPSSIRSSGRVQATISGVGVTPGRYRFKIIGASANGQETHSTSVGEILITREDGTLGFDYEKEHGLDQGGSSGSGNPPPPPPGTLRATPASVSIEPGTQQNVLIEGASKPYGIKTASNTQIATADFVGSDTINVRAVSRGTTFVSVKDNSNPEKNISIQINIGTPSQGSVTANPSSLTPEVNGVAVTSTLSGALSYTIKETPIFSIATATVSGSTLTVNGKSAGTTKVVVADSSNSRVNATIVINVLTPSTGGLTVTPTFLRVATTKQNTSTISGGSGTYSVDSQPGLGVTTSITGSTLTITAGTETGDTGLRIKDTSNPIKTGQVSIRVLTQGAGADNPNPTVALSVSPSDPTSEFTATATASADMPSTAKLKIRDVNVIDDYVDKLKSCGQGERTCSVTIPVEDWTVGEPHNIVASIRDGGQDTASSSPRSVTKKSLSGLSISLSGPATSPSGAIEASAPISITATAAGMPGTAKIRFRDVNVGRIGSDCADGQSTCQQSITQEMLDSWSVGVDHYIEATIRNGGGDAAVSAPLRVVKKSAAGPPPSTTKGIISITSSPVPAKVFLNGERAYGSAGQGKTPFEIEVDAGTYEVRFKNEGYVDDLETVTVQAGDVPTPAHGDLVAESGSSPPASVCGNEIVEGSEECDDGNLDNEDGCSSSCLTEPQEPCSWYEFWC